LGPRFQKTLDHKIGREFKNLSDENPGLQKNTLLSKMMQKFSMKSIIIGNGWIISRIMAVSINESRGRYAHSLDFG